FSKTRFPVPIVALSSDHRALRRMALHYGVLPHETQPPDDVRQLIRQVDDLMREFAYAKVGERIIVVAGSSLGTPGMLNGVLIHTVGSPPEHLSDGSEPLVEPHPEEHATGGESL